MRIHRLALPLLPLLVACAGAGSQVPIPLSQPPAGGVAPGDYVPDGEVIVRGRGATFSDWRIVGPTVNLTREPDGTWAGTILGAAVRLNSSPGRLKGAGGDLHFVRWGDYLLVQGMLGTRRVQVRYKPGRGQPTSTGMACDAAVATIDCSTSTTTSAAAELNGRAAAPDAPMPQLGLAILAAML